MVIRPETRAAAKAAASTGGLDARPAAENVVDFDGEDECGDENALKNRLKFFPLVDIERNHGQADDAGAPPAAKKDDKEPAPPEEIFQVLRGIRGLARDDLLRAYSMLIHDDRQFRSLMALPKHMRKD